MNIAILIIVSMTIVLNIATLWVMTRIVLYTVATHKALELVARYVQQPVIVQTADNATGYYGDIDEEGSTN